FYVDLYERTGFTGGLNWYRALRKDFEEAQGSDYVVDKPALLGWGDDDWFFPAAAYDGLDAYLPQIEQHEIADAGHWVQMEKPDEVNRYLVDWLKATFGRSAPTAASSPFGASLRAMCSPRSGESSPSASCSASSIWSGPW